jgi:hypothetical protein
MASAAAAYHLAWILALAAQVVVARAAPDGKAVAVADMFSIGWHTCHFAGLDVRQHDIPRVGGKAVVRTDLPSCRVADA